MTVFLKEATAATVLIGPFVDSTDGYTPETALTITAAEVLISKNGGALAAKAEASAATHTSIGYYTVALDTDDTDGRGALKIVVNEAGAFPVWLDCAVLSVEAWEALFNAKTFPANVTWWNGSAVGAPDTAGYPKVTIKDGTGTGELDTLSGKVLLQDGAVTAAVVATGAIDADALAADVIADIFQGTALTQSYATDGAAATPAQLLYMIWAMLAEKSVSGTTLTVKQLNGSTTAMTFTLNSATDPTSITRAT